MASAGAAGFEVVLWWSTQKLDVRLIPRPLSHRRAQVAEVLSAIC